MKVLVTGGAGFIGKYLVRSLLENDDSVTIFDNVSNSTKDSVSSLVNIGAKIIEGDITKPLETFGDGLQTRDFVGIDDVINSIHNAISNDKNGIYNIASGKAVTIKELAELIVLLSGKKRDIKYYAVKKGDIRFSQAEIFLAKKELEYSPKFELNEEIKELLG
jgi:UDP-glucose 4-epimerase